MEVLKVKKWKEKKDDLPQFEVICLDSTIDYIWSPVLLKFKKIELVTRVLRIMDGHIFELGKVFWNKKKYI